MEYCPYCHNLMRWYLRYSCGIAVAGYHCDNCNYDTSNSNKNATTSSTYFGYYAVPECTYATSSSSFDSLWSSRALDVTRS